MGLGQQGPLGFGHSGFCSFLPFPAPQRTYDASMRRLLLLASWFRVSGPLAGSFPCPLPAQDLLPHPSSGVKCVAARGRTDTDRPGVSLAGTRRHTGMHTREHTGTLTTLAFTERKNLTAFILCNEHP